MKYFRQKIRIDGSYSSKDGNIGWQDSEYAVRTLRK
jgi:hypothetical protein